MQKLFAWGGEESGGHVLRETTSRGLCGLVCPSRTRCCPPSIFFSRGLHPFQDSRRRGPPLRSGPAPPRVERKQSRAATDNSTLLRLFEDSECRAHEAGVIMLNRPSSRAQEAFAAVLCEGSGSKDWRLCVCLLLQDLLQSCARGGGGEWRTCAMRYDEPRLVWTRLTTTH